MGKINFSKVLIGGIVGGIALFIVDGIIHMSMFKGMMDAMTASGMFKATDASTLVPQFILSLVIGILGTYTYALARPRLGASYASAVQVAILVGLLIGVYMGGGHMIWMAKDDGMSTLALVSGFLAPAVGTFVGAWVYTD